MLLKKPNKFTAKIKPENLDPDPENYENAAS